MVRHGLLYIGLPGPDVCTISVMYAPSSLLTYRPATTNATQLPLSPNSTTSIFSGFVVQLFCNLLCNKCLNKLIQWTFGLRLIADLLWVSDKMPSLTFTARRCLSVFVSSILMSSIQTAKCIVSLHPRLGSVTLLDFLSQSVAVPNSKGIPSLGTFNLPDSWENWRDKTEITVKCRRLVVFNHC